MMIRKIIQIDEHKCDGCGICVEACHEGAIGMVDGKAKLLRDDYCDGLGDCLPACPQGAITFVEREAAPYDEAAVLANKKGSACSTGGCPGSMAKAIHHHEAPVQAEPARQTSQLRQWPVQIKLVPAAAPWFQGAKLLIAADCTATPTPTSPRTSSRTTSPWWAAPSWTWWTTPKNSPPFCRTTTSRASLWCGWKSPAAAASRWPLREPCRPAANSSPGRW